MKAKTAETVTGPFELATDSLETLGANMTEATKRGEAMLETSLKTWQSEVGRYFEEYLAASEATFKALAVCKVPMDVLTVEQQWLKRRAQAYLDSGLRFAQAFADVAKTRIVPPTTTSLGQVPNGPRAAS